MAFIKKQTLIFLTFIISFVIMTIAFANEGLYPFGEKQIMIIDSWHQYYPILQELHYKLTHGQSLLYSWQTGSGTNFLLMAAYYAMSPLNLFSVFFSQEYLREFMLFATITKIALSGAFFSIYIRSLFKKEDLSVVFFGILYAFSAFAMGYYWDIMWLDCFALLPLIILGMHRLMDEGRFLVYVLTLAIAIISNFYIAYFICEFIAIYFFVLYFIKYSKMGVRHFLGKLKDIVLFSLLSIGLAAVTLIPTIYGMSRAYGLQSGNPKSFSTYNAILDILNNLLANVKPTVVDGLPNIYSGLFALLLVILYFCLSNEPLKNKLIHFGLLSFFVFSFNINYLNFVWHGFHFPNQVPYRFSFLMSFVIITLAYQTYLNLHEIPTKLIWRVTGFFLLYLVIAEKVYTELFDFKVFYVSMALLVVYSGALLLLKNNKLSERVFIVLICYLIIGEATMTALNATETAGNSGRMDYPAQNQAVQLALNHLRETDADFYRMEMFRTYSVNDSLLYGYRGISQFSSTANAKHNVYSRKLGISADPGSNSTLYLPNTPVVNGLFSVKYMLSKHNAIKMPNAAYEVYHNEQDLTVLKNKFYMPLGFMVNNAVEQWDLDMVSPFEKQEAFIKQATDQSFAIFENVPPTSETYDNMDRHKLEGIRYSYKNIDEGKVGKGTVAFVAPKTVQMYAYMLNQTKTAKLTVDQESITYETPRGVIMDLGIVKKGTPIDLTFEVPAAKSGFFDIQVVMFDEAAMIKAREALIDEPFTVESVSDTKIVGTVTADSSALLYTSIPYEKGWTAKVDGVKTDTLELKEAILAIPVYEGVHTVELTYSPQGFKPGLMITVASGLIIAGLAYGFKNKKRRARRKSVVEEKA